MSQGLSQPPRDAVEPDELEAYDRVVERFRAHGTVTEADDARRFSDLAETSEVGVFFGALLHSPPLAAHISDIGRFYRGDVPGFTPGEREWVVEVVGRETGCGREIFSHLAEAVRFGVRPEALAALHEGRDDALTPEELELTVYVRRVIRGEVTPAVFEAIARRFGARGAIELTAFASHILMASRLMQALGADHVDDGQIEAELQRLLGETRST